MQKRLPTFLIIGAMKSATSTLYDQLLQQPGIFLPKLKEPNFFSDDPQFARGIGWYTSLFSAAAPSNLIGEASTHYTKLPTYPKTISRMVETLDRPRLIYIMRQPIDRMISHYVHLWSEGDTRCGLNDAISRYPELIEYSRYSRQLEPFVDAYGKSAILPVFFDRLKSNAQGELERICRFIGYSRPPKWQANLLPSNVSSERVRKFPFYDVLVEHPIARSLRQTFIPKSLRVVVRERLSMRKRPELNENTRKDVEDILNKDLAVLGDWLGTRLDCNNFSAITDATSLNWK